MPDGVIRYRATANQARDDYGDLPDGPFFAGLYLASQALRLAASGDPAAHREVLHTLDGMALLMDVTGRPGLLARWVARAQPASRSEWLPSPTRPGYFFRGDVSKDQLAGYACGLGVAFAVLPDPGDPRAIATLAVPLAEHLRGNDRRIVDVDGERHHARRPERARRGLSGGRECADRALGGEGGGRRERRRRLQSASSTRTATCAPRAARTGARPATPSA